MKTFDDIYYRLGKTLLKKGVEQDPNVAVRTKYSDGTPAYTVSIEGVSFEITPDMGVPILRAKRVPLKTPLIEIDWIWREMSNDVNHLNSRGVKIWDNWAREDGTIGRAYGWQLRNKERPTKLVIPENNVDTTVYLNQVEFVLHELKHNPASRRIMTTLFDVDDLSEMALEPCVWATHWTVHNGKLNLHVKQR